MRYLIKLLIFLFVFSVVNANPILLHFFNELWIDLENDTNWKLEMITNGFITPLDGWYLTTKSDTAYFKDGLEVNDTDYLIVTSDSLYGSLKIDCNGDIITLYDDDDFVEDELRFGDIQDSQVAAPNRNQSINLIYESDSYFYTDPYYLDNSPTLGVENDTEDALGIINGFIKDNFDNPLKDVEVIYDHCEDEFIGETIFSAITDTTGYFIIEDIGRIEKLVFKKEGYSAPDTSLQIWPDSTIGIYVTMDDTVSLTIKSKPFSNKNYVLNQNFPNPFNNQTEFTFYLPLSDFIEISIYNLYGQKVESILSNYMYSGKHQILWDASNYSSGVYIYRLITSQGIFSKKCLLIK